MGSSGMKRKPAVRSTRRLDVLSGIGRITVPLSWRTKGGQGPCTGTSCAPKFIDAAGRGASASRCWLRSRSLSGRFGQPKQIAQLPRWLRAQVQVGTCRLVCTRRGGVCCRY